MGSVEGLLWPFEPRHSGSAAPIPGSPTLLPSYIRVGEVIGQGPLITSGLSQH